MSLLTITSLSAETPPIGISLDDVGWQAHPEVWLLIAGMIGVSAYVAKVLQPKAVTAGYDPVTRRSKIWFLATVPLLWLASDWPVHDVAEKYLYSVHMAQHMVISMFVPAMLLLAMPRWLFQLILPKDGLAYRWLGKMSRPLVAGLLFNGLTMILHWTLIVQWSFESGPLHFFFHLVIFVSGLLMWMPVVGPVDEWRLPPVGQCLYLFLMSIVPTVPGGWLVFAEGVVYRHYDTAERLWSVDALTDQQAAGLIMKLVGGFFLWAVIAIIFGRWAAKEGVKDQEERRQRAIAARPLASTASTTSTRSVTSNLTFEQVADSFAATEAPKEPDPLG